MDGRVKVKNKTNIKNKNLPFSIYKVHIGTLLCSIILDIQTKHLNIESMTVFLNLVQESQELLSTLRHTLRGKSKFEEFKQ